MQKILLIAVVALIGFSSCKKEKNTPAVTVTEKTDSLRVNFSATSTFTFFNFKNGTVVPNNDSATNKWDIGLRFTTFLVNSGASGPGNAGAILQNVIYSSVTEAPATGYGIDTTNSQRAIKDGSWYIYTPATRSFSPRAGQTFFFRTADNYYVKFELLATDYEPFVGPFPSKLIYRFRYTYQANGSRQFN